MRQPNALSMLLLLTATASVLAACGGGSDDRPDAVVSTPPPPPSTGDGDGDGDGDMGDGDGDGDMGDGDMGDGDGDTPPDPDAFNLPGAPEVELSLGDGETEFFSDLVSVSCVVRQSEEDDSLPPDATSVEIFLLDDAGEDVLSPTLESGEVEGEYVGSIPATNLPSGPYAVRCVAGDVGEPVKYGMAEAEIFIDHGPRIVPVTPTVDEFLAGSELVSFEIRISADELLEDDLDAQVKGAPTITIHGTTHELTLKPGTDDIYWLGADGFDLDDPANFDDEVPNGPMLVTVRAENARDVERVLTYELVVDNEGPSVTLVSPEHLDIIGQGVTFVLDLSDDYSGVDLETLVVRLANQAIPFETESGQWEVDGDEVSLTIQTSDYAGLLQLSFNVDVADQVGNLRESAGTVTFRLDQHPPVFSLDPPNFRLQHEDGYCSVSFDPVGDAAVNTGDDVLQTALVRGIAWDRTNGSLSDNSYHFSSIDPASVQLWFAPAGEPLVISDDGDGVCDSVDVARPDVQLVEFGPIAPKGAAYYGAAEDDISSLPSMTNVCDYKDPPQTTAPEPVCDGDGGEDMSLVITHSAGNGTIPAVFSFGVQAGIDCTGSSVEVQNFISLGYEGWVCAAMSGQDYVGNRGVSAPIAFCLDNGMGAPPACSGLGPAAAPDCTDTCTPVTFPADGIIIDDH